MLKHSDTNIEIMSAAIVSAGHDVAFLVPTKTGMEKSIMDAHDSVRAFLKRNEIHDFDEQKQGARHYLNAYLVTPNGLRDIKISLYRPISKNGDPRIWIYDLKKWAMPYNLIALILSRNQLFIVNCSIETNLNRALLYYIPKPSLVISSIAEELLCKLKYISSKGFIPTIRNGDTGVGKTLESLLGIAENSSKSPDYKGIEIKSARINQEGLQRNKSQLFSMAPKWKLSPIKSAKNLILTRGYIDTDGQNALRHTISGIKPNSRGLYLDIDYANDYLRQMFISTNANDMNPSHDMTWILKDLRSALLNKHKETFWVKALYKNDSPIESFHYIKLEHTQNPYINRLETLLENGLLTIDYTLHIKPNGKPRDHGYLFKLKANSIEALFPKPMQYDLTT